MKNEDINVSTLAFMLAFLNCQRAKRCSYIIEISSDLPRTSSVMLLLGETVLPNMQEWKSKVEAMHQDHPMQEKCRDDNLISMYHGETSLHYTAD